MATIRTSIQIQDRLSQPMRAMHNAVSMMVNQMEAMHTASGRMMDTSSVQLAQRELARAAEQFNRIENEVNNAGNAQQRFTNNIRDGTSAADGLLGKIMGIAAAYLSFQTIGNVVKLSDEMTSTTARLNLINDGLQTTAELQQMIFDSAQRSRGAYADTADMVAKLAMNAGDAFKTNVETVAFAELINKQFVIAGTNAESIASATLQLTQAMGSGVLRGEELNAVFEATPVIIQNIAKYLGVSIGKIREMASDGQITAQVVKSAMFAAANDINNKFNSMPYTWAQLWTDFKNEAMWAFRGVLDKINEVANSDKLRNMMQNAIGAMGNLAAAATFVMDILTTGGSFVYDNWSLIAPVLWGVTAALGAYGTALLITKAAEIASTIWLGLKTLALGLMTATSWAGVQATMGLTAAQWGLNAALMANPIFIIIMAIIILIGIIYIAVAAINHFAGTSYSATGAIAGFFMMLGAHIYNVIAYLWNIFAAIAEFFVNVWRHPMYSVKRLFANLANNVLDMAISMIGSFDSAATNLANMFISGANMAIQAINWVIDALNKVPGIDIGKMSEFSARTSVTADLSKLKKGVNNWVGEAPADYWEAPKMEMKSLGAAYDTGYNWGKNLSSNDKNVDKSNTDKAIENAMKNAGAKDTGNLGKKLDKGNRNGGKTAGNTAKMAKAMEGSGEDLKYLRDIAEREAINRYTTAEINIDMKNENHINNEMDIDGVIDKFGERAEEVAEMLAEGGPTTDV